MVTAVVCINLFFSPVIALWIHYKRRGAELASSSVKLLLEYAVFAVCNVPLTKIGVVIVKRLLGKEIFIDSGYYTLLAILSAVVLPYLLDSARKAYRDREKILKMWKARLKKRSLTYKQKLSVSLLLVLLIIVAYVIRGPLEIYAGNVNDFLFTLGDFLPWLLVIGIAILVIAGCLLALLSDAFFRMASVLLLWFGVASWVQDLFLNIKLTEVNGGPLDWGSLGSFPKTDLMIWLALLAGAFFLCVRRKASWFFSAKLIAGGLCLVQLIAVGSVLFTMPEQKPVERTLSGETEFQLAAKENVVVLIVDSVGIDKITRMMEQYPEAAEIVKDFTYYDNVCFDFYSTYPSVTHFLTGNEMNFSASPADWLQESWNTERCNSFYRTLKNEGYKCRLYSPAHLLNYEYGSVDNLQDKFDNIEEIQMKVDTKSLLQKLLSFSAYRFLPYVWKQPFEVLTMEFSDVATAVEMRLPVFENAVFYERLNDEGLSVDPDLEKLLYVQYLVGAHTPWHTTAQATFVEEATEVETMRGIFTILQNCFDQMKTLGIYDSATIIVMADHCDNANGYVETQSSMFYLKRANETHTSTKINHAPVDYDDFQATILELIGRNDGSFGTSFFDWHEGDMRQRILWLPVRIPDYPNIEGCSFNAYYGYVYYKDAEELRSHIEHDEPDFVVASTGDLPH